MKLKTRRTSPWKLGYLDAVERDARKFLTSDQYAHVVGLFEQLAAESDPTKSKTQDVRKIEDFYELRDKGGILGKINVRVYFTVIENVRLILALHVCKKEAEGQTPSHVKLCVRNRLRVARRILAQ